MDTKTILSEASDRMQKTIEHLEEELLNILSLIHISEPTRP